MACSFARCNYVKETCGDARWQGAATRPARPLHMCAGAGPASPTAQARRGTQGWLRNERCFQLSSMQGYHLFWLYCEAQFKGDLENHGHLTSHTNINTQKKRWGGTTAFCPTACILSDLFHCLLCSWMLFTLLHINASNLLIPECRLHLQGFLLVDNLPVFSPVNFSLTNRRYNWSLRTNFQPSQRIHWFDFCFQISV